MTTFDRTLGLARSLAVYHAIPFRQRRLRRLYAGLVRPGDVVFDIGAHAGNRVRGLAALGCRVVAVEPQPTFARMLRLLFGRSPNVTVIEAAVAETAGRRALWVSDRHPTLATQADAWREARQEESGFAGVQWDRQIEVQTTTLDLLIARFGLPTFVKIDVEGAESSVLAGLSSSVPALSFEYLPGALDQVAACAARLELLGRYEFNWSAGETFRLQAARWLTSPELLAALNTGGAQARSGDIYARLTASPDSA